MQIGILHSRIRKDEKTIIKTLEKRGHEVTLLNNRQIFFALEKNKDWHFDLILERCISHARALYSLKILAEFGLKTVNNYQTAEICGNKILVSEALIENNVPTPETVIAFSRSQALAEIAKMGYPVVLKPAVGSWGTLLAKVNDIDSAQAVLAHKKILGSYHHATYYLQKFIPAQEEFRLFVIGNEIVGAIHRESDFWIKHLDQDALINSYQPSQKEKDLACQAAHAVRGGILAVDILKSPEHGLQVLEVDYTIEFSKYHKYLNQDLIVQKMVDYLEGAVS